MLNKWRVKRDLSVSQSYGPDDIRRFGKGNEGVIVEAINERNAVLGYCRAHNLNPFYFKAVLER